MHKGVIKFKKSCLILILLIFVGIVLGAHNATVTLSPLSVYEGSVKNFTLSIYNSKDSNRIVLENLSIDGLGEVIWIEEKPDVNFTNSPKWIIIWDDFISARGTVNFLFTLEAYLVDQTKNYTFKVLTKDTQNDTNTALINITVLNDELAPRILDYHPKLGDFVKPGELEFWINVSDKESGIDWVNVSYDYYNKYLTVSAFTHPKELSCEDGLCKVKINITYQNDKRYLSLIYNVSDVAGNMNSTPLVSIMIDNDYPIIKLLEPIDDKIYKTLPIFRFNVSDGSFNCSGNCTSLEPLLFCNLSIDGTIVNSTIVDNISNVQEITANIELSDGLHYWNITCQDKAGWINTSETWNFTIDSHGPNITLVSPANDSVIKNGTPIIFGIIDAFSDVSNAWYDNGSANISLNFNGNDTREIDTSSWQEGKHEVVIYANDTLNNINSLALVFYVDNTSPIVLLSSPLDNSLVNASVTFSFISIDDWSDNLNCTLVYDNASINILVTNGSLRKFDTILGGGVHYWNVTCIDEVGNKGFNGTWKFEVDNEVPQIQLVSPQNNRFTNNSQVTFSFNVSDNKGIKNCSLILNSNLTSTILLSGTQNESQFTVSNLSENMYSWVVECYDTVANKGTSETRNLTVDLTPPEFDISVFPAKAERLADSVKINWSISDNFGINIIWLGVYYPNGQPLYEGNVTDLEFWINWENINLTGRYNISARANDYVGNYNFAEISFNVTDTQGPWIVSYTPNSTTQDTVRINFTLNENASCEITNDNISINGNGTFFYFNAFAGVTYIINCSDQYGNSALVNISVERVSTGSGISTSGGGGGGGAGCTPKWNCSPEWSECINGSQYRICKDIKCGKGEKKEIRLCKEKPTPKEETQPSGTGPVAPQIPLPECSDGIDNDDDGKVDYPEDPQCLNELDDSEAPTAIPPTTGFIGALKTSGKYLAYLAALIVGLLILYAIYQYKRYPRVKNVLVEKAIKEAKYKKTS